MHYTKFDTIPRWFYGLVLGSLLLGWSSLTKRPVVSWQPRRYFQLGYCMNGVFKGYTTLPERSNVLQASKLADLGRNGDVSAQKVIRFDTLKNSVLGYDKDFTELVIQANAALDARPAVQSGFTNEADRNLKTVLVGQPNSPVSTRASKKSVDLVQRLQADVEFARAVNYYRDRLPNMDEATRLDDEKTLRRRFEGRITGDFNTEFSRIVSDPHDKWQPTPPVLEAPKVTQEERDDNARVSYTQNERNLQQLAKDLHVVPMDFVSRKD